MTGTDWLEAEELRCEIARILRGNTADLLDETGLPMWHRSLHVADRLLQAIRDRRARLQLEAGVIEAPMEMAELAGDAVAAGAAFYQLAQFAGLYSEEIFPPIDFAALQAKSGLDDAEWSRLHAGWARHLFETVDRVIEEAMTEGGDDSDPTAAAPADVLGASRPH